MVAYKKAYIKYNISLFDILSSKEMTQPTFACSNSITDDKISFKTYIENIFQTTKYKLHALQPTRKYLSTDKAKSLCSAFISSQFYYAPLITMFAGKLLISRIQKIHFRSLQVVHVTQFMVNYFQSIFQFNSGPYISPLLKCLNHQTT